MAMILLTVVFKTVVPGVQQVQYGPVLVASIVVFIIAFAVSLSMNSVSPKDRYYNALNSATASAFAFGMVIYLVSVNVAAPSSSRRDSERAAVPIKRYPSVIEGRNVTPRLPLSYGKQ
jgi:hypothetical protein